MALQGQIELNKNPKIKFKKRRRESGRKRNERRKIRLRSKPQVRPQVPTLS